MHVVIFQAVVKELDEEYARTAARMRELAIGSFGCVRFESVQEGDREITLSYWNSEGDIIAWRAHPEHQQAQERGRAHWYTSYQVEVAHVERSYGSPLPTASP